MSFFSIIIPTYNRAHLVSKAIESVIAQTFANWELLVVDDGSKDNTKEVVDKFLGDSRIQYVYQENAKESAARNNGISRSKGQFICLLDSDDYYLDHHLQTLYDRIVQENFQVGVYHTLATRVYTDKPEKKQIITPLEGKHAVYKIWKNEILIHSAAIHRDITLKHQFRVDIFAGEDTEFFFRVALEYPVFTIEEYTVIYVIHDSNSEKFYQSKPFYYESRLRYLFVLAENTEFRKIFPSRFFESRIADMYRWKAYAHHREKERVKALGSLFQSVKSDGSYLLKLQTYKDAAIFLIK